MAHINHEQTLATIAKEVAKATDRHYIGFSKTFLCKVSNMVEQYTEAVSDYTASQYYNIYQLKMSLLQALEYLDKLREEDYDYQFHTDTTMHIKWILEDVEKMMKQGRLRKK